MVFRPQTRALPQQPASTFNSYVGPLAADKQVSWIHVVRAMCSNRKMDSKRPSGDFCQVMDPDLEERPRSLMIKQIFPQNVSDRLLGEGLHSAL